MKLSYLLFIVPFLSANCMAHGAVAQNADANIRRLLATNECPSCDLRKAQLVGADLSGANLYRADLKGAILSEADLTGAILSEADLTGADLTGANCAGAITDGAIGMSACSESTQTSSE